MFKYGCPRGTSRTLTEDGAEQSRRTANYIKTAIGLGDRVKIYSSPREWEIQTANIIREEFTHGNRKSGVAGLYCEVEVLPWLYVLENGHIIVDSLRVESFVNQQKGHFDHIIVVAGTDHVECWPCYISGKHGIDKVPYGHCITVDCNNHTLSYSNK